MKPRSDDFQVEQQIMLGGKISHKHKEFMDMARMSPEYADAYFLVKKTEEWLKNQSETEVILDMIMTLGQIDFLRSTTELTRLSMIMGDTREHYNVKRVMDELRKAESNTQT